MASVIVPLDLTEGDKENFINMYVQEHMSDIAWEVFMEGCHDDFNNDKAHETALAKAVVNEMVNNVLIDVIEKEEGKYHFFPRRG